MSFRSCRAWILVLPLFTIPVMSWAEDGERPVCRAETQGLMWPDVANRDRATIASLAHCGELLLCVRGIWRYHWESASVTLDQLSKRSKTKYAKPSDCEVRPVADKREVPDATPGSAK